MAMTSIPAKLVRSAGQRILKEQDVHSIPFDRLNEVKRLVILAGLAIKYDTLLYVTYADLVALGFITEPIVGDDFTKVP